jgi:hypothetical protein
MSRLFDKTPDSDQSIPMGKNFPPKEFNITLADGTAVKVKFEYSFSIPHFEFRGEGISSTGYRSHSLLRGHKFAEQAPSEAEMKAEALEVAEIVRKEYLAEQVKEAQRARRKSKEASQEPVNDAPDALAEPRAAFFNPSPSEDAGNPPATDSATAYPSSTPKVFTNSMSREFKLTLSDGTTVDAEFHYVGGFRDDSVSNIANFKFRGEAVSKTGYYSYFPPYGHVLEKKIPSEAETKAYAQEFAEYLRQKFLVEQAKEARLAKRNALPN